MKKLKIGIVGCGAIGSAIALASKDILKDTVETVALYDLDKKKLSGLAGLINKNTVSGSMDEVFDKSDLVVEAAGAPVSPEIVKKAIEKSKSVMIMSVGGLIGSASLLGEARSKAVNVYFPSGAISGLDALKAAKVSKIESVTLTTRKPPKGLAGAPYLKKKGMDIASIKGEQVVFEGSASEAVKGFPRNINVASLLSLAGLGSAGTRVRIISSPDYTTNTHEVEIKGDFGRITAKTENVPFERNPKTSKLAALSAIATIRGIAESVKFGT